MSLPNAADAIHRGNERGRAGGWYLDAGDLAELIDEVMMRALRQGSLAVCEGRHDGHEPAAMQDLVALRRDALAPVRPRPSVGNAGERG